MNIAICGTGAIGSFFSEILVRTLDSGNILLIDGDRVELHNLSNQNYTYYDIGALKATALYKRIHSIANPNILVTSFSEYLTDKNISRVMEKFNADLIVDCFDNAESRMMVNEYCLKSDIECLHIGMSDIRSGARWGSKAYMVKNVDTGVDQCDRGAADVLTSIIATSVLGAKVILEFLKDGKKHDSAIYF